MNNNLLVLRHLFEIQGVTPVNIEKFMTIIRGDSDLGVSLLMLFKQQAVEYLDNLNYGFAVYDKNPQKLFEAAHAIKGASLSIAAEKIAFLSNDIESKIRDNKIICHENYHELIQETQELLNYISTIETRYKFLK